jgi:hypothetical protein
VSTVDFDYDMFTQTGNAAVHGIVLAAIANDMEWEQVEAALIRLARTPGLKEATDTAVREAVYTKLFGE